MLLEHKSVEITVKIRMNRLVWRKTGLYKNRQYSDQNKRHSRANNDLKSTKLHFQHGLLRLHITFVINISDSIHHFF